MSNGNNSLSQADLLSVLLGIVGNHGAKLESVDISTGLVSIRFPLVSSETSGATTQASPAASPVPAYEAKSPSLTNLDRLAAERAGELLRKRSILAAVREYREITGKPLRECKQAVEDLAVGLGYGFRDCYNNDAFTWLLANDR